MWIRSQNKTELMDINYIRVYKEMIRGFNNTNDIILGVYSTEEKALKVMDMIEQNIQNSFVAKTDYSEQYSENSRRKMSVFQMPQDNEVE